MNPADLADCRLSNLYKAGGWRQCFYLPDRVCPFGCLAPVWQPAKQRAPYWWERLLAGV